jgi:hypothetical protein
MNGRTTAKVEFAGPSTAGVGDLDYAPANLPAGVAIQSGFNCGPKRGRLPHPLGRRAPSRDNQTRASAQR